MVSLMDPIASCMWRRPREYSSENSSFLKCLADLAKDDASLYSAEFSFAIFPHGSRNALGQMHYSLSVCKSPSLHTWCRPVVPPSTSPDFTAYPSLPCLTLFRSQSRIGDSDFFLQLAQPVGLIPRLAHVKFSFSDARSHSSSSMKPDRIGRVLHVLLKAICSQQSSSVLKRIILDISSDQRQPASDFLTMPEAIPSLEILDIRCPILLLKVWAAPEEDNRSIASFLRTNKSLQSLRFSFQIESWAQILPTLKIAMEPLILSRIDALGSTHHKQVDSNLLLQKLELVLELGWGLANFAQEAVKIMTTMVLDTAGSKFAVGEFLLTFMYPYKPQFFELIMRMEQGALMEILVPACDRKQAEVVEKALRLNRGPSVLLLGPLLPRVMRKILSPLIPDHNGLQANTCVSTLNLLNISVHNSGSFRTEEFQLGRLEEVANMLDTNSTVEHLEVWNRWFGSKASPYEDSEKSPPMRSPDCPVVAELQTRLRPGGNMRSFTFCGQELQHMCSDSAALEIADNDVEEQQGNEAQTVDQKEKVQCRRHLKPKQVMKVKVTMERAKNFW